MNINIQKSDEINIPSFITTKNSEFLGVQENKIQAGSIKSFGAEYLAGTNENVIKDDKLSFGEGIIPSADMLESTEDEMILMSHTLSEEDYKKLQEEGFDLSEIDISDSVTIVDRIKAEVLKGGTKVAGYNDNLSDEVIEDMLLNSALADAVVTQFAQNDIPVNEENIKDVAEAAVMLESVTKPTEGEIKYMISKDLEPTVFNLYLSESAGAVSFQGNSPKYFRAENYVMELGQGKDLEINPKEIERLADEVETADIPREEVPALVKELVDIGEPVTAHNVELLNDIENIEFPVDPKVFAKAAANAIMKGKSARYANLADKADFSENIERLEQILSAGINREETRFKLTAEVNLLFLKQGISFDTSKIEEVVEALKEARNKLADRYFPNDIAAPEKFDIFTQTNDAVLEIKELPVAMLASPIRLGDEDNQVIADMTETLSDFTARGRSFKIDLEKAGEEYEKFFTEVRRDLGDSIQKAFANVDDILDDLNIIKDEDSRRAVKILGHNSIEITKENIEKVEDAYLQVKDVAENLKPGLVLKMVRENLNPLKMNFNELKEYIQSEASNINAEAKDYAKFLYKLEQRNDITPEEREGFVGIYKMMSQIARGDFSAVGMVLEENAELNLQNLLSAARTKRTGNVDLQIADDIEIKVKRIVNGGVSAQIEEALAKNTLNLLNQVVGEVETEGKEQNEDYKEYLEALNRVQVAKEVKESGIEVTPENITAMSELASFSGEFIDLPDFAKPKKDLAQILTEQITKSFEESEDAEEFADAYKSSLESGMEEVRNLTMEAENSVDVKAMRLINKQMNIASTLADSEEFYLPLQVGEEMGKVRVRFDSLGDEASVRFNIFLDDEEIEAAIFIGNKELYGAIKENNSKQVMNTKTIADNFNSRISQVLGNEYRISELVSTKSISNMFRKDADINGKEAPDKKTLFTVAKEFLKAFA